MSIATKLATPDDCEFYPAQIIYAATNYFTIPPEFIGAFPFYLQETWSIQKFREELDFCTILCGNIRFIPIYRRGASRTKLEKRAEVRLSFRIAAPEYNLPNFVLIS